MRMTCAPLAAALLATTTLCACTTTGVGNGNAGAGYGNVRDGTDTRVMFSWRGEDKASGQMTATVADGRSLAGKYFLITSDTQIETLGALWDGWGPGWRGWPYWYMQPGPQFVQHYSGRVLANLSAADGEPMWCSLQLLEPASGMAGGGEGVCQLQGGRTVDAMFPRRSAVNLRDRDREPAAASLDASSANKSKSPRANGL